MVTIASIGWPGYAFQPSGFTESSQSKDAISVRPQSCSPSHSPSGFASPMSLCGHDHGTLAWIEFEGVASQVRRHRFARITCKHHKRWARSKRQWVGCSLLRALLDQVREHLGAAFDRTNDLSKEHSTRAKISRRQPCDLPQHLNTALVAIGSS